MAGARFNAAIETCIYGTPEVPIKDEEEEVWLQGEFTERVVDHLGRSCTGYPFSTS